MKRLIVEPAFFEALAAELLRLAHRASDPEAAMTLAALGGLAEHTASQSALLPWAPGAASVRRAVECAERVWGDAEEDA